MKKSICFLLSMLGLITMSCTTKSSNANNRSDEKVNEQFQQSLKSMNVSFIPDESINKLLFVKHYEKNPDTWKTAFAFISKENLSDLPDGRYELADNGMYATVSSYETKERENTRFEVHRKFIDIHFVAQGEEYIEILPLEQIKENADYDERNDIIFFNTKDKGDLRYADKKRYLIIFPEDVHKPSLKTDSKSMVKKIVVKIPV